MFDYDWDWRLIWTYRYAFLEGVGITFALSAVAVVLGTAGGFALGAAAAWLPPSLVLVRRPLLLLIDAIKALPPLLLLLLFYYWMPYASGIRSPFWIAVIALAVNLAAFVADVLRHAISGVPRPLVDACYALGMTRGIALRRVVFPEALRSIVPTLGYLYLSVVKLSSLASIIAVRELLYRASEISTYRFRFLEVYAALAVIYLMILMPFSYLVRRLETSALFVRRS